MCLSGILHLALKLNNNKQVSVICHAVSDGIGVDVSCPGFSTGSGDLNTITHAWTKSLIYSRISPVLITLIFRFFIFQSLD